MIGASKMTPQVTAQVTALITKTGNLNSIPGTHIMERQTYSYKLTSDLHSGAMTYVYMCVYTQTI